MNSLARSALFLGGCFIGSPLVAQTIMPVGAPGLSGAESAIATRTGANSIVVFEDATSGALRAAVFIEGESGGPQIYTVDSRTPARGRGLAIEIGNDRLPIISYFDDDAVLHVAKCGTGNCVSHGVDFTDAFDTGTIVSGAVTAIAIAVSGNPVIAYYDQSQTSLRAIMCSDPACNLGTVRTIDELDDVGKYNDVAIGSDGSPVFSYYDDTRDALKVAWCASPDCVTGGIVTRWVENPTVAEVGQYTSIAIGANGFPLVSYFNATNQLLKLAACGDLTCDPASTDLRILDDPSGMGQAGFYSRILVPADGRPVVSYLRLNGAQTQLAFARCVSPDCAGIVDITRPDRSEGISGFDPSMSIGSNGFPLISYYDGTNMLLKVLRCDSAACDVMFGNGFEG